MLRKLPGGNNGPGAHAPLARVGGPSIRNSHSTWSAFWRFRAGKSLSVPHVDKMVLEKPSGDARTCPVRNHDIEANSVVAQLAFS